MNIQSILSTLFLIFFLTSLNAASLVWDTNNSTGKWNDPKNWLIGGSSCTCIPTANDDVFINAGNSVEINEDAKADHVELGGTLTINAGLILRTKTAGTDLFLTSTGASVVVNSEGSIHIDGQSTNNTRGVFMNLGGIINNNGAIIIENVSSGISAGRLATITNNGELSILSTSSTAFSLFGTLRVEENSTLNINDVGGFGLILHTAQNSGLIINNGTINMGDIASGGLFIKKRLFNSSTGIININSDIAEVGIELAKIAADDPIPSLDNEGIINIKDFGSDGLKVGVGIVENSGTIDISKPYTSGSGDVSIRIENDGTLDNIKCGIIKILAPHVGGLPSVANPVPFTNNGYLFIDCPDESTFDPAGFVNNGVVQDVQESFRTNATITPDFAAGLYIFPPPSNSPDPNFTYWQSLPFEDLFTGEGNNIEVVNNQIYLDEACTQSAGVYNPTSNTWFPNAASTCNTIFYVRVNVNMQNPCPVVMRFEIPRPILRFPEIRAKVILQGAYDAQTGLMRDDLRQNGLIPEESPYNNNPAGTNAFDDRGEDSVVDWVELTLIRVRDNTERKISCFVQRDGDIVSFNGFSLLGNVFYSTCESYIMEIRYRNHLAIRTAEAFYVAPED